MQKSFLFLGFEKGSFNADQAVSVIGAANRHDIAIHGDDLLPLYRAMLAAAPQQPKEDK